MAKKNIIDEATIQSYKADKKIRKGWGDIRPVTRVIKDKRNDKAKQEKEKEIQNYVG